MNSPKDGEKFKSMISFAVDAIHYVICLSNRKLYKFIDKKPDSPSLKDNPIDKF